jgi:hypothetical protein
MAKRFIRSSRCSSRIIFLPCPNTQVFAFRSAAVTRPVVIDVLQTGFLRSLRRISRERPDSIAFPFRVFVPRAPIEETINSSEVAPANAWRTADIRSASIRSILLFRPTL